MATKKEIATDREAHELVKLEQARKIAENTERNFERLKRSIEDREREVYEFENKVKKNKKRPTFNHLEHTDKSRRHIAFVFVYGYIILVTLIIIGVPVFNVATGHKEALELQNILAQAGALIGSPLGFVVGYYFKEDSKGHQ